VNYVFRPLDSWAEGDTKERRSRWSFRAGYEDTLRLLEDELWRLDARNIVLQADFSEGDLRMDGMPRSNARQPVHPGVRVAFNSRHGPLVYATDAYEFWQHNLRAVALGLGALRAVDRYGVTKRGEQYTGWKQLTSGIAAPAAMTVEAAAAFIAAHTGERCDGGDLLDSPGVPHPASVTRAYRAAAKRLHPDNGGDPALFRRLQDARELLERHGGGR